ncbi:MAG: Holliday junction resolvase Hjc [Pyrodictiaceae archaeon]
MPSKPKKTGSATERELVHKLWQAGFAVIRAPSSGAGARRIFYPDVVAMYKGAIFVFEVKRRVKSTTIYLDKTKISRLLDFAERAGGKALLAVKTSKHWLLLDLNKLIDTQKDADANNKLRIRLDQLNNAITINEFITVIKNKPLINYMRKESS